MEIYERIRYLRKTVLNMTQDKFGARLGTNRDTIANIEQNRLARPEQKEPLYKLICKEFNVNYDWLMTGEGGDEATFNETEETILADISLKYGLDKLSMSILKTYIDLPENKRKEVNAFVKELALNILDLENGEIGATTDEKAEFLKKSTTLAEEYYNEEKRKASQVSSAKGLDVG